MSHLLHATCFVGCWFLASLLPSSPLAATSSAAESVLSPRAILTGQPVNTGDTASSDLQEDKKQESKGKQQKQKKEAASRKANKDKAKKKDAGVGSDKTTKNKQDNDGKAEGSTNKEATAKKEEGDGKGDAGSASKKEESSKTVDLKGVFAATRFESIRLRPKEWKDLKVLSAVKHGELVSEGDTLIQLDTESLDRTIQELEQQTALDKLALTQATEELRLLRQSTPLSLEQAKRRRDQAAEDLKLFEEEDRQRTEESANFMVKRSTDQLAYQQEELNQLEKMYEADDLTEETEEIILRRTRDEVESAEYSLKRVISSRDRTLAVELPRSELRYQTSATQAQLNWEQAQIGLPSTLKQQEIALKKLELALKKAKQRLKHLQADREFAKIKAPISGYIYFGVAERGKWKNATTVASMLKPGGSLKAEQVLMTIVRARPLEIYANIAEKDLSKLQVGDVGTVVPTADPNKKLTAEITKIQRVPIADGEFAAILELESLPHRALLMPGMTCKISFDLEQDK